MTDTGKTTVATTAQADDSRRERLDNTLILSAVTAGHAISHFIFQGFLVALPAIKDALMIGPVQVGAIMGARELAAGLASLPGGVICDRLRRYWGLILTVCMLAFGLGWLVVGLSPSYSILIAGMALLSVASSIWHLPAMAALSQRFSDRRGTALAIHGVGGAVGDVSGPILTGLLLTFLAWRGVINAYAAVPIFFAIAVAWVFRNTHWLTDAGQCAPGLRAQVRETGKLLSNPTLWGVNLVAGLRGMCYQAYTAFLPLFLAEEVGFDSRGVGFHLGLLFSVGIVASPLMGYLSDRVGRKTVVVPTLLGLSVLSVMLAIYGQGRMLTVIIFALGLFLRSDYSLLSAMVLDVVGDSVATTTLGITSFTRFVIGAVSPVIAGFLYKAMGMAAVLYYVAGLYALAAALLLAIRLRSTEAP
jgi:MFS family permease